PRLLPRRPFAVQLRAAVCRQGVRRVRFDVRLVLRAVEDVVGGVVDQRQTELGDMARAADVDRGGILRVCLGAVHVGPGGGVQDELSRETGRREGGDVPVGARQREDVVSGERLLQRTPELTTRAGDQDSAVSRSDRIGDLVLHRSTTRGSSHGHSCSSGSPASYSSVTWYSIKTSVRASNPCARFPGT